MCPNMAYRIGGFTCTNNSSLSSLGKCRALQFLCPKFICIYEDTWFYMFYYDFEAWIYILYWLSLDYDVFDILEVKLYENDDILCLMAKFLDFEGIYICLWCKAWTLINFHMMLRHEFWTLIEIVIFFTNNVL